MDSAFGQTFLFLTKLAWKSKITIPILVSAVFLAMDFRMQIELNYEPDEDNYQDDYESSTDNHEDTSVDEDADDEEDGSNEDLALPVRQYQWYVIP